MSPGGQSPDQEGAALAIPPGLLSAFASLQTALSSLTTAVTGLTKEKGAETGTQSIQQKSLAALLTVRPGLDMVRVAITSGLTSLAATFTATWATKPRELSVKEPSVKEVEDRAKETQELARRRGMAVPPAQYATAMAETELRKEGTKPTPATPWETFIKAMGDEATRFVKLLGNLGTALAVTTVKIGQVVASEITSIATNLAGAGTSLVATLSNIGTGIGTFMVRFTSILGTALSPGIWTRLDQTLGTLAIGIVNAGGKILAPLANLGAGLTHVAFRVNDAGVAFITTVGALVARVASWPVEKLTKSRETLGGESIAGAVRTFIIGPFATAGVAIKGAMDSVIGPVISATGSIIGTTGAVVGQVAKYSAMAAGAAYAFVAALSPSTTELFNAALKDITAVIGIGLLPIIEIATEMLREAADMLLPLMRQLQPIISELATAVKTALLPVLGVIISLVGLFIPLLQIILPIVQLMANLFKILVDLISALIRSLAAAIGSPAELIRDIKSAVQDLTRAFIALIVATLNLLGMTTVLGKFIQALGGGPKAPAAGTAAFQDVRMVGLLEIARGLNLAAAKATEGTEKEKDPWAELTEYAKQMAEQTKDITLKSIIIDAGKIVVDYAKQGAREATYEGAGRVAARAIRPVGLAAAGMFLAGRALYNRLFGD